MKSKVVQTSRTGLFAKLGQRISYVMAPFFPSAWKPQVAEPKGINPAKVKRFFCKIAIYYLLFSPVVAMPFYNTCIFHPFMTGDYQITELGGVKKQDVFFKNTDGSRLHGWYFKQNDATKTVLVSHGNAGNITHRMDLIKLLLKSGTSVFIYDYSGFGLSKGSASVDGCCNDAVAAYDCLAKELKIPAKDIVLYGESIGTGFTCQLAEKRPCAAVVLQSGFRSLPLIAREKIPPMIVYPDFLYRVNHLNNLSYVQGAHPPLLIIHGEQDNIIPYSNAKTMFAKASAPKALAVLPKAGHNDVPFNMTEEASIALKQICQ